MKDTERPLLIPVGTLIKGDQDPGKQIRSLAPSGFETFSIMFWQHTGNTDLGRMAEEAAQASRQTGTPLSSLSIYGNPLDDSETGQRIREDLARLIRLAPSMDVPIVSCFAGRVPGTSVPDSIPRWYEVFAPLTESAELHGVRIAFENCRMGDTWKRGSWNIAINPDAWDLMFSRLDSPHIGLEWEPCHQVEALIDPLPQLSLWLPRILHVHGKDSRIDHDLIRAKGLYGKQRWHASCFPGRGDTDWHSLFRILLESGYQGTVDIEGWNDRDYDEQQELTGQKEALRYLLNARSRALSR
ncbi:MAG: sugar phosphate isomerase/epimerase [Sphaerochaetaceae bacterium]|nr:sugar phosphate isomerase/epimerase [Sphaerochaetaceae bacterium]